MAYETVNGYCWPQSVAPGERVALHLSSAGGRPVSVEVARVGMARDVVFEDAAVPADDHPTPTDAPERGCDWPAACEIVVDADWRSGYYEVLLTIDVDGKVRTSRAFFVVRPDLARTNAKILWAIDTNTWHAYNDFGGRNLYTGATQASMLRPMAPGYLYKPPGAGQRVTSIHPPDPQSASHVGYLRMNHLSPYGGSAGWPNWSLPFIDWAEREGYAIDVVTNADLEEHPELLGPDSPYSLYLSIGHDEYWSAPMRDTVEAFTARGGHAVFFSGNTAFWQVRLEDPTGPDGVGSGVDDGRLQGLLQAGPGVRHRPAGRADHDLVRPSARASREPHDRRQLQPRRLPPHRQTGDQGRRWLHAAPARALDLRRHRPRLRRPARIVGDDRRLRVRRLRLHLPRRPAVPDRRRRHTQRTSRSSARPRRRTSAGPRRHDRRHRTSRPRTSSSRRGSSTRATRRRSSGSPTATPCSARS